MKVPTPRFRRRIEVGSPQEQGILEAFYGAFRPPPKLTVSEWADTYRVLSPEAASEPGPWKTSRMEPLRGILDSVSDPLVRTTVVMKSAQVGYTEGVMNALGYFIDQDPASTLVILPNVETARDWSRERLAPMIRDTPKLAGRISDPKSRDGDNSTLKKTFAGGFLAIIGANAPAGLSSRPIRFVLGDEIDRFPRSAGSEGSPLKLAAKRQTTFWNRKSLLGSTPTIKGFSNIEREYQASDMRRWYVPCPHCDDFQTLRWEQVKWDRDGDEHRPETAHYMCESCGTLWTDAERWEAINKGEWRAEKPFVGIAGFHLPAFASTFVSLADVVQEFVDAQGHPDLLQVWVNTVLGETWEEQGEKVDEDGLAQRVEAYGDMDVPEPVVFFTAGVDVQKDRLECSIYGWGAGEESWKVKHEVLFGDPSQEGVWEELDELLLTPLGREDGRMLRVRAACVDTGGHHANAVHQFCRRRKSRKVYAIKGAAGPRQIWPKRGSKARTGKADTVYLVGVDTAKDTLYGRLGIQEPGPGYVHFDAETDREYFKQLTSESVVTRYKEGQPYRVWVLPQGRRNEALDCSVYALAARQSIKLRLDGPRRSHDDDELPREKRRDKPVSPAPQENAAEVPKPKARTRTRTKRGGFLGDRRGRWL